MDRNKNIVIQYFYNNELEQRYLRKDNPNIKPFCSLTQLPVAFNQYSPKNHDAINILLSHLITKDSFNIDKSLLEELSFC